MRCAEHDSLRQEYQATVANFRAAIRDLVDLVDNSATDSDFTSAHWRIRAARAIYDGRTGETDPASLFVAVLGASTYTFAYAAQGQHRANWIDCHIRAFELGTTKLIVPDNPRTGVDRACRYEPDLNRTYQEMAEHYGTAIMPARPYKPRDKTYVSYCTSFRLCTGESWLPGTSASVSFNNDALVQWFV